MFIKNLPMDGKIMMVMATGMMLPKIILAILNLKMLIERNHHKCVIWIMNLKTGKEVLLKLFNLEEDQDLAEAQAVVEASVVFKGRQ